VYVGTLLLPPFACMQGGRARRHLPGSLHAVRGGQAWLKGLHLWCQLVGEHMACHTAAVSAPHIAQAMLSTVRHICDDVAYTCSPEWVEAMLSCSAMGAVCVPLYDSLTLGDASAVAYILTHSGAEVVFVQV
jgi:hypothetical protein